MANEILVQMISYLVVLLITFGGISVLLKGFFFNYMRVRGSLGKKVLVKIRSVNRDYYAQGWIEENNLVYETKLGKEKVKKILMIPEGKNPFYRSLNVNWVDVDEEKNAICFTDYTTVSGFDSVKYSHLLERALKKPVLTSSQDKIIIICLLGLIAIGCLSLYFNYSILKEVGTLKAILNTIQATATVTPSPI